MAKEPKVASATGTAGGADKGAYSSGGIQDAMTAAAEDCASKGIADPDEVRKAKLKAREAYKVAARAEAEKAAKKADR